jgi:hypothetical protein
MRKLLRTSDARAVGYEPREMIDYHEKIVVDMAIRARMDIGGQE